MFEVLKVPMAFTWEIYGDESASYDDCFRMFNPLGKAHFDEVRGDCMQVVVCVAVVGVF
jgi:hypothetical protein